MNKKPIYIIAACAALVLGLVIFAAYRWSRAQQSYYPTSSMTTIMADDLARKNKEWLNEMGIPAMIGVGAYSNSMKPLLGGDTRCIAEVGPMVKDLVLGDITLHQDKGDIIVHQVMQHNGDNVWTAGINNAYADRIAVDDTNFRGRVCIIIFTQHTQPNKLPDKMPDK